uniref:Uncharacterized protein n=1 Tax=Amblyomma parvum TaxID=251391 RepID=A0A023FZ64_AMBPA
MSITVLCHTCATNLLSCILSLLHLVEYLLAMESMHNTWSYESSVTLMHASIGVSLFLACAVSLVSRLVTYDKGRAFFSSYIQLVVRIFISSCLFNIFRTTRHSMQSLLRQASKTRLG